ncbi:MAG: winged helix DNA-binding domain-containing protein [Capsulimonas sp.]|uniref:winged helix DNA-binding domain-containing protein n=1 Tax=Capsulimonas sp. TaxID=2494211 RepID=UPI00326692AE
MRPPPLLAMRLARQQITRHDFQTVGEVAAWMGATQAQDYAGAKWSLGLRLPGVADADIERAIADKAIVRTTSLRGTLHFLAAGDVRWVLKLLAPRVMPRFAGACRAAGLTESEFAKSAAAMVRALEGGCCLSRTELLTAVEAGGVSAAGTRPNYLLYRAALDGVICHATRRGKEFTFALLDEWSPGVCALDGEEASAELARRYFQSHGPATIQDFARWSGQSLTASKAALGTIERELERVTIEGSDYWMSPSKTESSTREEAAYLLPGFDEYSLGYADRSAVIPSEQMEALTPKNGIFTPLVVYEGRAIGTWGRTVEKGAMVVETKPFTVWSENETRAVAVAVEQYCGFHR